MEQPTRLFAFRLCLQLGILHPDYLLDRLTSRQIAEWMAYFKVKPFGQDHTDYLVAQLTAVTFNANSRKKQKTSDFLPLKYSTPMKTEDIKRTLRGVLYGSRRKP